MIHILRGDLLNLDTVYDTVLLYLDLDPDLFGGIGLQGCRNIRYTDTHSPYDTGIAYSGNLCIAGGISPKPAVCR